MHVHEKYMERIQLWFTVLGIVRMADRSAVPNEKQAITPERKLFGIICQLKTFGVQQRLGL